MLETPEFVGIDKNPTVSLKQYGIVSRNEKSDQHLCVYKINDFSYDYSFLYESEIKDLLELKSWVEVEKRDGFLAYCGRTLENFLELPFAYKVFSMIQFFGLESIMGKSLNPMTHMEAVRMIES